MEENKPAITFMAAARKYFGLLPGENIAEFNSEIKKLEPEDRTEIVEGMRKLGFNVETK